MSFFGDYLNISAIRLDERCANRKKALESIASLLSVGYDKPASQTIFKNLMEREKLGSTGLGHGIAVPHCRMPEITTPRTALLRIPVGIDFNSPDDNPVCLFCAMVINSDANEEHLNIFSKLVQVLNDVKSRERLLQTQDARDIITYLQQGNIGHG